MTEEVLESVRLIGVIPISTFTPDIKTTIRRIRGAHDRVIFVYPPMAGDDLFDGYGKTVFIVQSPRKDRRTMIQTAIAEARRLNMTHILIHDPESAVNVADIPRLINAAGNQPDAVIIGHQKPLSMRLPVVRRIMRWGAAFMFRLQTGIDLRDPGCPMRVYPLWIFDCLKIRTYRNAFDTEILVKAAWAGVPIKQVALETSFNGTYQRKSFFCHLGEGSVKSALNIHWAMRSITPIPHRKVVDDRQHQGQKVSVWHPLRSIRTLLTESLTPVKLAWAVALGVFLGTLPLIALHTVTILLAAGFFRLNKAAALAASQLCMPPIVPALCIEVGYFLRHGRLLTEISVQTIGYQALERIWEWFLGSLLVAPVLAVLFGGIVYGLGRMFRQEERQST